jgi:hypothetical protein
MIKTNIEILKLNMKDLIACINKKNLYYTYELLVANIVSAILRLTMYISIYYSEIKDYISEKINKIKELYDQFITDKIAQETLNELYKSVTVGDVSITSTLRNNDDLYADLHETMNILTRLLRSSFLCIIAVILIDTTVVIIKSA